MTETQTIEELIKGIAHEAHAMGRVYEARGEKVRPSHEFQRVDKMVDRHIAAARDLLNAEPDVDELQEVCENLEDLPSLINDIKSYKDHLDAYNAGIVLISEVMKAARKIVRWMPGEAESITGPEDKQDDRPSHPGGQRLPYDPERDGPEDEPYDDGVCECLDEAECTCARPDYDPEDFAFSPEFKARMQSPRLVPVQWPRPTLDQMPEGESHVCSSTKFHQAWLMLVDGEACCVARDGSAGNADEVSDPSRWTVLDAPPAKPKTVRELTPGMITTVNGRLSIVQKNFTMVDLLDGAHHAPTTDTPITGEIYKMEATDGE